MREWQKEGGQIGEGMRHTEGNSGENCRLSLHVLGQQRGHVFPWILENDDSSFYVVLHFLICTVDVSLFHQKINIVKHKYFVLIARNEWGLVNNYRYI